MTSTGTIDLAEVTAAHLPAVQAMVARLSPSDLTLMKEPLDDPSTVTAWVAAGTEDSTRRYVALDGEQVVGLLSVYALSGWSSHVAELRLTVDPTVRRRGIGTLLARAGLAVALRDGRRKISVELVADQEPALRMFSELGFIGEALLAEQIRDAEGEYHDLILLAHFADRASATLDTLGIPDALT